MNEPSPYQPPLPQGPPSIPYAVIGTPPTVTVLGILHLVFAGFGVLVAIWGLFISIMGNPFLKLIQASPQMSAQMDAQMAMQEKTRPMTLTASTLSLLVAIPMVIAGIQLLRKRKNGLKWSNAYAFSSLGAKFANLMMTVMILIPAMQEMSRGILKTSRAPSSASDIMAGFMTGGAIGGVLVSCAYPVITLILLNRPRTKEWFASLTK